MLSADNLEFSQLYVLRLRSRELEAHHPAGEHHDVTVEDDCLLQMFKLKKILVQTAGTGYPCGPRGTMAGIQAVFVKVGLFLCFPLLLPSRLETSVLTARLFFLTITRSRSSGSLPSITHTAQGTAERTGGQGMSRKNATKQMEKSLGCRMESLRQLVVATALTQQEADTSRVGLMMQKEDLALTLLGIYGLKCKGQLTSLDYDRAKQHPIWPRARTSRILMNTDES